jgi:NADPH-dependent glutamate synthase beta subunit-like oxidoreductase/NAD-dependent dihydropyrimidine dehydrogenase PreA subunit
MRNPKDRLYRVLVIGATPAGIAATNKLGEIGIPVTLVDPDPDLNQKLSREEWRLSSGVPLNYAHRPGLLRILRNPHIRCVIPGDIRSLKHTPQGFCAHITSPAAFIDPDRCTLCGRCMEVCPVTSPDGSKPIRSGGRQSLPGHPVIDKRRQPLCQANCPLGVNAQGYVALAKAGKFPEALDLIRRDNVLPGICGRVCTHPCEIACRRGELDQPVAIRDIKRFVADYEISHPQDFKLPVVTPRPQHVAIIGSGPAGLSAAADLARLGYPVTVFEKEELTGGLLRYGLGPHRLPREILDREIAFIQELGVQFRTGTPVDLSGDFSELKKEFAAIILAIGVWKDRVLGVPGEELKGVEGCLSFLTRLYRGEINTGSTGVSSVSRGQAKKSSDRAPENVAVIGDGNAAFDLARTLSRIGARVTVLSWFPESLIPADAAEIIAAREEGISIKDSVKVIGFAGSDGKLGSLRCVATRPGPPDAAGIPWPVLVPEAAPFDLNFDKAFVAIGQTADPLRFGSFTAIHSNGYLQVNDDSCTSIAGVYAAGDSVEGPSSVVKAMASGRKTARAIHLSFGGKKFWDHLPKRPQDKDFAVITPDIPSLARVDMPERQPAAREGSFAEVTLGLNESQVCGEAARCLQCGACSECLECVDACVAAGAIRHGEVSEDLIEQAGIIIIADPDAAPAIKGDDVIRAYSTKTAKNDVHSMTLRGFAAATDAMLLLGGGSQRLKGHGLAFSPPDPRLSPEIRMGVFVCRCNDALGWSSDLSDYVAGLCEQPHIEHAQVLSSACTPEGSAALIRTIREKGLTRVVLASCVCCPLDFICSACTDQRSRLKHALFSGTGISRAMVETCNLRGEVLRLLKSDPVLAKKRFKGLIARSIHRTFRLKALPAPARPYNFTTAVIGDSEAALKSAMTLAQAGVEVFLFGTQDRAPLPETLVHPNIHNFGESSVERLRGTVGNFEVTLDTHGVKQIMHAGAVILGEQSRKRVPYMPMADLPAHTVESAMQKRGITGIPFFNPGATSIPGLFLANPAGIAVSDRIKGTAAAILAAAAMPRSPRQNKGYTVSVDEALCRGCGRCIAVCPYQAISFRPNAIDGWYALVDEALCKGCGNCIAVCPSNAADSPYRDRKYLNQMIAELLL